ncbi:MAG: UDP-N-acetylglucosamine 1-carboxyvinyltransferase [Oscillospiraceae bacterium]|nr:UDP-N-acetylglucosamine 1-carboxyvinyltransferase [Oscillospiraceae bacterium]
MQRFVISGGNELNGDITLQGAKNSALPILSASVLVRGSSVLSNCPDLTDIYAAARILTHLGCKVHRTGQNTVIVDNPGVSLTYIPDKLMREMRSSITFLGPVLGECSECRLCLPGGCQLGPRPIDIHLDALRQMGVTVCEDHGGIYCKAEEGVKGAKIVLPFPSVGATENIIMAAVKADGDTEIKNAAREPEIVDLASYLNKCGAKIHGAGESTISISGVKTLNSCEYSVMPDRIAAATYMSAALITGGKLRITGTDGLDIESFAVFFGQMGCSVYVYDNSIYVKAKKRINAIKSIKTLPYPGFPTDMQAIVMAPLSIADGTSIIEENIFESRYKHVDALNRMGADIKVYGKVAVVHGVNTLYGADIEATDLRGGAAMVIAALAAEGTTEISEVQHIDRGYESFDKFLHAAGADIVRKS